MVIFLNTVLYVQEGKNPPKKEDLKYFMVWRKEIFYIELKLVMGLGNP
jgi:hypothetical protein